MDSCAGVNPAQLWPALEHLFQLQNAPVLVCGGKLPLADAQALDEILNAPISAAPLRNSGRLHSNFRDLR
jgi:hypothetical protein